MSNKPERKAGGAAAPEPAATAKAVDTNYTKVPPSKPLRDQYHGLGGDYVMDKDGVRRPATPPAAPDASPAADPAAAPGTPGV